MLCPVGLGAKYKLYRKPVKGDTLPDVGTNKVYNISRVKRYKPPTLYFLFLFN